MSADNPPPTGHAQSVSSSPKTWLAVCAAFFLGLSASLLVLFMMVRGAESWPSNFLTSWLQRTTRSDLSQPTVVDRIQRLQRLETVIYTMDKIVTGEKESSLLPNFLAGDRLLLLVHGEVIAGIDFQALKPGDVHVDGKRVRVRVPHPLVLVTKLDSGKTRVYSRQTGLLVATDPNLESRVRDDAERDLQRSALSDGILQKAQENARTTITSLVQSMGFEEVQFEE